MLLSQKSGKNISEKMKVFAVPAGRTDTNFTNKLAFNGNDFEAGAGGLRRG